MELNKEILLFIYGGSSEVFFYYFEHHMDIYCQNLQKLKGKEIIATNIINKNKVMREVKMLIESYNLENKSDIKTINQKIQKVLNSNTTIHFGRSSTYEYSSRESYSEEFEQFSEDEDIAYVVDLDSVIGIETKSADYQENIESNLPHQNNANYDLDDEYNLENAGYVTEKFVEEAEVLNEKLEKSPTTLELFLKEIELNRFLLEVEKQAIFFVFDKAYCTPIINNLPDKIKKYYFTLAMNKHKLARALIKT